MRAELRRLTVRRGSLGIWIPQCLLLACLALLTVRASHAQDEEFWDRGFAEPQYLVHITETGTERGPEKRDHYILHPKGPDENGILMTADGYGGWFINKAETAGGPYSTPRDVCDNVKSIPPEKLSLGFDCRQLWALTDCAEICKKSYPHGIWDGESEYPACDCRCEKGYELLDRDQDDPCVPCGQLCWEENQDPHLVYDPVESVMNVCACKCEVGYSQGDSGTCEKIECPGLAKNMADLQAGSAFTCPTYRTLNRHCCCDQGAQPWGGVCQKEVDLPPERRQWGAVTAQFVGMGVLTATLQAKDYQAPTLVTASSYDPKSYPPGTVVFWAVEGTDPNGNRVYNRGAHVSMVVNSDGDQIEMGAEQVGTFQAGAPPNPPKTNLQNATYSACEIWRPPDGAKVKPGVGRLLQMPRGAIPKTGEGEVQKWEWNCHGFVKAATEVYVAVPDPAATLPPGLTPRPGTRAPMMKDPPGVPVTLELQQGGLYGDGLALDVFVPGGFVEATDRFLIEVGGDGSTQIYVFDGQANVFSDQDGTMVHVPEDQMVVIRDGIASDPGAFEAGSLDRWWGTGASLEIGGLTLGLGGLVAAGSCLAVLLAGGVLVVWQASRRRPRPTTARPATTAGVRGREKRAAEPTRGRPGEGWGKLTVFQGAAPPRTLGLDKPALTVGRGSASDLVLLDSLLSRRHAQIRREGDAVLVQDLASTNGTFVNGARVTGSHELHSGDVIAMGHTRLVFESETVGRRLPTPLPRRLSELEARSRRVSLVLDRPILTIGRGSANDLVLVDSHVSRRHAQIVREGGDAAVVHDLGSSNGTFVNGRRVSGSCPLRPGDVIRVGQTELVFGEETIQRQPSARRAWLVLARGSAGPSTLELGRQAGSIVRIGRSHTNGVVVEADPRVSRHHAEIHRTARGYEIVGLGAEADVLVNGERVQRAALRPGDRIRLGNTEFAYRE